MSKRASREREGFKKLPNSNTFNMVNPNDATIDIPLMTVNSRGQTGARKATPISPPSNYFPSTAPFQDTSNEKAGLFHRNAPSTAAGRRKRLNEDRRQIEEGGSLNSMGKFYNAILTFSVVTRYLVYVLPAALLIAVPIIVGAFFPNADIGGVRIVWLFTWVEVVWLSLWVSKLVAQFLPFVFQFLCGVVSSGTRKYALVLKSLEIPLSLVGWALASLATFIPIMTRNPSTRAAAAVHPAAGNVKTWESTVRNILWACLISTLVFLAEKVLVQLISISYHRKQFDAKIKQSKHNLFLLGLLYDASRNLFPAYCTEFAAEDYIINDSLELKTPLAKSGSATPMRLIQNVGRLGDKVTAAFGNVAHEITGKEVFNPTAAHSIVVEALEKTKSSEALARRLWMSFVVEGKEALYAEDIAEVLGADRQIEAEECFAALDRDGNGDISLDEMILTVCEFGRERKSIANSMHDVDQAINVLDNLLITVVFVMVVFIFVAFLNKSFTTTLATTGTALLSLSFVFAATAQEVLGSCIFLFVKHPFDVGDRVDIGDNSFTVERISLLYTVFRKVKDHKTTQVPNIVLNTNWIDNVSRSKAMREQILLYISFDTTLEDIQLLKNEMQAFVLDKDNSRDFQTDIDVEVTGLNNMDKMELKVEIRHKSNWSNEAVRAARRSKFMCALVLALRKIPIYAPGGGGAAAGDPANPSYSVAITDAQAAANKSEFAEKKAKSRMIPPASAPPDEHMLSPTAAASSSVDYIRGYNANTHPATVAVSETTVVETLNIRNPTLDPAHEEDAAFYRSEPHSSEDSNRDDSPDSEDYSRRSNDIDEVRGLLHRASTKGRRKAHDTPANASSRMARPGVPTIPEPTPPSTTAGVPRRSDSRARASYHDYAPPPNAVGNQYPSNNPYSQTTNPYQPQASPPQPASGPAPSQVQNRRPVPGGIASLPLSARHAS